MKDIAYRLRPRQVRIHASAEFTSDMAANLAAVFHQAQDERVIVNFSDRGVWAVTSAGTRVFIGATYIFESDQPDAAKPKIQ